MTRSVLLASRSWYHRIRAGVEMVGAQHLYLMLRLDGDNIHDAVVYAR